MTKTKADLEQDLVDLNSWLDATKDSLDSVLLQRDDLKRERDVLLSRVQALEELCRVHRIGEFEQAGDDNSYSEVDDDGTTVH